MKFGWLPCSGGIFHLAYYDRTKGLGFFAPPSPKPLQHLSHFQTMAKSTDCVFLGGWCGMVEVDGVNFWRFFFMFINCLAFFSLMSFRFVGFRVFDASANSWKFCLLALCIIFQNVLVTKTTRFPRRFVTRMKDSVSVIQTLGIYSKPTSTAWVLNPSCEISHFASFHFIFTVRNNLSFNLLWKAEQWK